jgi:trimeric autotransporter adhesin
MKNLFATAASIFVLGFAVPALAQSSTSKVDQIGTNNGVTVDQIGITSVNDSKIKQGLDPANYSSSYNRATVTQDGSNVLKNTSKIDQDGYDNHATATQGGNGSGGDTNDSVIDQGGASNYVTVTQGNAQEDNDSRVKQSGTANWATVDQGGPAEGISFNNISLIDQSGYGNEAHVHQGGGGAADNFSKITQGDLYGLGGDNYALVNQHGLSDNESTILQDGTLNGATIDQNSAINVSNISILTQLGWSNSATVKQH